MTTPTISQPNDIKYATATWTLAADEEGDPVGWPFAQSPHKSVQISGTVGAGAVTIEGSMDGTNWDGLTTDGSTAISGPGLHNIHEKPLYIRPVETGGGGTTDMTIILGAPILA